MTQYNERLWQVAGSSIKIHYGLRRLERHDQETARLRRKAERWSSKLLIVSLMGITLCSLLLWEQWQKTLGPSHYDKIQLQRLIDGAH